jgi:hypothetical protein
VVVVDGRSDGLQWRPCYAEKTHTAPRLTSRACYHGQSLQPVGDVRPNFRPLVERHSFLELAEPQLFLEDPKRLRLRSPAGTLSPPSSVARAGKRPAPCGGRAATSLWRRAESCNPKRGPAPPPSASPFSSRGTCCPPCFCPEPKPPAFSGEASTGTVARQDRQQAGLSTRDREMVTRWYLCGRVRPEGEESHRPVLGHRYWRRRGA